ncbi:MAG: hypothetical protein SGBAC_003199 [Bacillariaceae sp.]
MSSSCNIQLPVLETWIKIIAVQVGLVVFVAIPLGTIFYYTFAKNNNARSPTTISGLTMIVGLVTAFQMPDVVARLLSAVTKEEEVHWMVHFVTSCVGFASVFKSFAIIQHNYPPEVDLDFRSFLCWYVSFTEPVFLKDKMKNVAIREILDRGALLVGKVLGLFTILTCFRSFGLYPSQYSSSISLPSFAGTLIDGFVHVWFIYFFLAFALDFGIIFYSVLFFASVEPGFTNPLLTSRSMRECWAQKWNLSVQILLKRNVYIPCRKAGIRRELSTVLTFLASGLLHEYTFSTHNTVAYRMGEATLFFTMMGMLVLVEGAIASTIPLQVQELFEKVPSVVISSFLVLSVAAAVPLFLRSWLESGVIEATSEMFPHFLCTSESG